MQGKQSSWERKWALLLRKARRIGRPVGRGRKKVKDEWGQELGMQGCKGQCRTWGWRMKEQEVRTPREWTLEPTMRKKSDQEDPLRKRHQDWQQDGAETACWSEPQRGCPEDQPLPSGAEAACRVACGQPPSSVSLASLETRLDTLRTGREQLFEKLP